MKIDLSNKNQLGILIALAAIYMVAGGWIGKTTAVVLLVALSILAGWGTLKITSNPTYAFVASALTGALLHFSGAFEKFAAIGASVGGTIQVGLWVGVFAFVAYQGYKIFGSNNKG